VAVATLCDRALAQGGAMISFAGLYLYFFLGESAVLDILNLE